MPSLSSSIMTWVENEKQYIPMRAELLKQKTNVEHQLLYRISTITDQDNSGQVKEKVNQSKQQRQDKCDKCLIIHYTHEQRLASYKRDVHQIWDETFKQTPVKDTKLIVGNRNNRNTAEELVSKRPVMPMVPPNNVNVH